VRAILLSLLVGCASHQNCGENGGSRYGRYLDPKASCWDMKKGDREEADYALCTSGAEEWLCSGEPWCRPLGPNIRVQRVGTTAEVGSPMVVK
jgi:hypothetical protein